MKQQWVFIALEVLALTITTAEAQTPAEPVSNRAAPAPVAQRVERAGGQPSRPAPSEHFTGSVRIAMLWAAGKDINASGAYVTFEPGARTAWHNHPAGQRLVVVSGIGLVQEWGKPIQEIRPGDVVSCPPGVKHWHGAAPGTAMTHLAVSGTTPDGKSVEWMEKVSDAQYGDF